MSVVKHHLKKFLIIVSLSFIWSFVVTGIVAYVDKVFYIEQIEPKLPEHSTKQLENYAAFKRSREIYKQKISDIDIKIQSLLQREGSYSDIDTLMKLRQMYQGELTNLKQPIVVSPYYHNRTVYYIFAAYVFLGVLVFQLMPVDIKRLNLQKTAAIGLLIYIGWMSTGWLRNFVFYDEGRTIFSYANYDIDRTSFFLQELRTLGVSILIAMLWQGWIIYAEDVSKRVKNWTGQPDSLRVLTEEARAVIQMSNIWQINSIIIVAAFLPWTIYYWVNVMSSGDARYIIPAIVMHLYWAISWMLITVPLAYLLNKWSALKTNVIAAATENPNNREPERTINLIKEINPLTGLQIFGASMISIASVLWPLINLLT